MFCRVLLVLAAAAAASFVDAKIAAVAASMMKDNRLGIIRYIEEYYIG